MVDCDLVNRRIVVTGAASGMGQAIAMLFARHGARQFLLDVNKAGLDRVEAPNAERMAIDVSDRWEVERAIARAGETMGGIDGVLNVAGVSKFQSFADSDFDDFAKVLGVNLYGPFHVCKSALPYLTASDRATIVNVTSIAAHWAEPGTSAYSASKAGLGALTRVLAAELGPKVRVNSIAPGMIDTPMFRASVSGIDNPEEHFAHTVALRRPGTPAEIAEAALFLMSERSSFTTGVTLTVDGGNSWR